MRYDEAEVCPAAAESTSDWEYQVKGDGDWCTHKDLTIEIAED